MSQGWSVNGATDTITFYEPPGPGGTAGNVWRVVDANNSGQPYDGEYDFTGYGLASLTGYTGIFYDCQKIGAYYYSITNNNQNVKYSTDTLSWQNIGTGAVGIDGSGGKLVSDGTYGYYNGGGSTRVQRFPLPFGTISVPSSDALACCNSLTIMDGVLYGVSYNYLTCQKSADQSVTWSVAGGNINGAAGLSAYAMSIENDGTTLVCYYKDPVTGKPRISYSTNSGASWATGYTFPTAGGTVNRGLVHTGSGFICAASNGETAYSADGQTWTAGPTIPKVVACIRVGLGKAVIGTAEVNVYESTNGGATWTEMPSPVVSTNGTHNAFVYWIGGDPNITVTEYASGAYGGSTSIWALGAWSDHFGFPYEVEYYGDRMFFANTRTQPQTIWGSRVGAYSDFGKSSPIQDDDALVSTLNARQINEIRDLVPLDSMLCMTTGGEWKVTGGSEDVLTPSSTGFQPQSYRGVSNVQGVVVGNSALFIQDRGSVVRDMAWKFDSDGYDGNDLSIFASHLIDGHTLVDMAYQQYPNSVVWLVRSDGALLGLTYVREQEVVGWHRHDTDGFVENVCCIPEDGGDALYICVRRTINGNTKRYVERLESRDVFDQLDCFFVDCGLTYDGRNVAATTVTVTGGTLWDETESLTITASAAIFTFTSGTGDSAWNGDQVKIGATRFSVVDWVSTTVVTARVIGTVPTAIRGVATTDFTLMRDRITGLGHLEGKTVAVLSDGNEEGQKVVASGAITLDRPGGVVHVGLPYVSDLETLEVNAIGSETIRDRKKTIPAVTVLVDKSAGVYAGPDFDHLEMHRPRDAEAYDQPTPLLTGAASINVTTRWEESGRLCIRQSSPLPLSVLGVIPELKVAG